MADHRSIALTDTRRQILELAQSEGAISASDVAQNIIRGRNQRAATKALRDLHALGLLTPIRTCEYRLSDAGQARLDSTRSGSATVECGETSEPLARPDPLSDEQWRAVYQMVVARYQHEVKAWNHYRSRKADAPFTGATPVPPTCGDGANMEGIMIAIAKHIGLMP